MSRWLSALTVALALAAGLSSPASADVVVDFDLTFTGPAGIGGGTGVLTLDLPNATGSVPITFASLSGAVFSSLTANVEGVNYDFTSQNAAGLVLGATPASLEFATAEAGIGFQLWDFIETGNDTGVFGVIGNTAFGEGTFTFDPPGGPAPAVPELSTWAMLIIGFAVTGALGFRRSRQHESVVA